MSPCLTKNPEGGQEHGEQGEMALSVAPTNLICPECLLGGSDGHAQCQTRRPTVPRYLWGHLDQLGPLRLYLPRRRWLGLWHTQRRHISRLRSTHHEIAQKTPSSDLREGNRYRCDLSRPRGRFLGS